MSTTPRTDAAVRLTIGAGFNMVSPSFARELETELTAAKAECDLNRTRCEELHTIIDTTAIHRAPIYAKMKARAEKAEAESVKWNKLLLMSRDDREKDLMSEIDEQARLLGLSANQNAMLLTKVNNLSALWSQFIDIMDIVEESDGGNEFRPNRILSCRALDAQKMSDIIEKAKQLINTGVKSEH